METLQAPVRPPWLFTSESARANVQIAIANRRAKAEALRKAKLNPPPEPPKDASPSNPLAEKLARVQDQLVKQMEHNSDPKSISALAMALKNVRETYHLVTGQAKPGVIRETGRNRGDRKTYSPPTPVAEPDAPQDAAQPGPQNS